MVAAIGVILSHADPVRAADWLCGPNFGVSQAAKTARSPWRELVLAPPLSLDALVDRRNPDVTYRLGDIAVVPEYEPVALAWLQAQASKRLLFRHATDAADFAGRHVIDVRMAKMDETWQETLLRKGWGMVLPETGRAPDDLIAAEDDAMSRHVGIWAVGPAADAYRFAGSPQAEAGSPPLFDAGAAIGRFAVIDGVLRAIEHQEWRSYLNFGDDWRRDFTIALSLDQREAISAAGIALENWIGRKIRVRGTVEMRGGPYIGLGDVGRLCLSVQ